MQLISNFRALKLILPVLAAITMLALAGLALPAQAADPDKDLYLKAPASGLPDIEVSSDGTFVALVYFKNTGNGAVYLKSGEVISGWRTRANPIGFTSAPPKLVFSPASTNTVYAVWQNGLTNKSIRYAICNLAQGVEPDCPTIGTVYGSTNDLSAPDLAVDSAGLHLAWKNVDTGGVETLYLPFPLSGLPAINPTAVLTPAANENYHKPALAAANDDIYLTLLHDDSNNQVVDPQRVQIYHSNALTHSWKISKTYVTDIDIDSRFGKLDNPAITAQGDNIMVVWDALSGTLSTDLNVPSPHQFGLVRAEFSDSAGNWSSAEYITSSVSAITAPNILAGDIRASRSPGSVPAQKVGLRPSLAVSDTGFALAWQQRPVDQSLCRPAGTGEGEEEEVNGSSEIYVYENNSVPTGWSQVKHATPGDYNTDALAPDIAIGPGGDTHLVYMKAITIGQNCSDDTTATDYGIYYQGPPGFMGISPGSWGDPDGNPGDPPDPTNDPDTTGDGDDAEAGDPHLPIIFKNF